MKIHRLAILAALLCLAPLARAQDDPNPKDQAKIVAGDTEDQLLLKHLWRRLGGPGDTASGASTGGGSITTAGPIAAAETKGVATVTTTSAVVWTPTTATLSGNLQNTGTTTMWLSFGGTAVAGQGTFILANGAYVIDANNRFAGAISAVTASGTTTASYSDRH